MIKTQRIGKGKTRKGEEKKQQGQVLNRGVRRTYDRWELEAELRHAELIIEQLGLVDGNAVSTPGTATLTPTTADDDEDDGDVDVLDIGDFSNIEKAISCANRFWR